jgi:hypothetical protein
MDKELTICIDEKCLHPNKIIRTMTDLIENHNDHIKMLFPKFV